MSFIRAFDDGQIRKMTSSENGKLFRLLKSDVLSDDAENFVFPAVRKNEMYFYYKGGCLYRFKNGAFRRDKRFELYDGGAENLTPYERAKKQTENKFTKIKGGDTERLRLNRLSFYTFSPKSRPQTVVIDAEVNLNGEIGGGKKCDMVLFDTQSKELIFVEGKVFSDKRMLTSDDGVPKVVEQVLTYTDAIARQSEEIVEQYGNHIKTVNLLFGTSYPLPERVAPCAKLLVYDTPSAPTFNGVNSINRINESLGAENVLWASCREEPTPDEIRRALCK